MGLWPICRFSNRQIFWQYVICVFWSRQNFPSSSCAAQKKLSFYVDMKCICVITLFRGYITGTLLIQVIILHNPVCFRSLDRSGLNMIRWNQYMYFVMKKQSEIVCVVCIFFSCYWAINETTLLVIYQTTPRGGLALGKGRWLPRWTLNINIFPAYFYLTLS